MKKLLPLTLALALTACASPTVPPAPSTTTGAPSVDAAAPATPAAPAEPVVTGATLTGTATFGDAPLAGATVTAYMPGSDAAITSVTADASGKFELPIEALGTAKLVKLVAKSGDKTVVTLYAVPERAASGYQLFQAAASGFTTTLSTATTVAYVSLGALGGLTGKATLSTAQASQLYQAFQTITTEVSKSLDGLTVTAKTTITTILTPVLSTLSPTGEGTLSDALGKQLLAQNPSLSSALSTGVGTVKNVLTQALPTGDTVSLAQVSQSFSFGGQIIATTSNTTTLRRRGGGTSGGVSGSLHADSNVVSFPATAVAVVAGDRFTLTGADFGADPSAIALTSNAQIYNPTTNVPLSVVSVAPGKLVVQVHRYVVPGPVQLTVSVGGSPVGNPLSLTVKAAGVATVSSLSVATAKEGDEVTVMGSNLGYYTQLAIAGSSGYAKVVRTVPGGVVMRVPLGVGTNKALYYQNFSMQDQVMSPLTLNVLQGPPMILGLADARVLQGGDLVLQGQHFSTTPSQNVVTFAGASAPGEVTASTATSLTVTVPIDAQSGPLSLNVSGTAGVVPADVPNVTIVPGYRVLERDTQPAITMYGGGGEDVWAYVGATSRKLNSPVASVPDNYYTTYLGIQPDGTLWQVDYNGATKKGTDPSGPAGQLLTQGSLFNHVFAFGPNNQTFAARVESDRGFIRGGRLCEYIESGGTLSVGAQLDLGDGSMPSGLALDGNGDLWLVAGSLSDVGAATRLYKLRPENGTFTILKTIDLGLTSESSANQVCVSGDTVYTFAKGPTSGWRLSSFDLAGDPIAHVDTPDDNVTSAQFDAAGRVSYVASSGIKRIADGTVSLVVPGAFRYIVVTPTGYWAKDFGPIYHIVETQD